MLDARAEHTNKNKLNKLSATTQKRRQQLKVLEEALYVGRGATCRKGKRPVTASNMAPTTASHATGLAEQPTSGTVGQDSRFNK